MILPCAISKINSGKRKINPNEQIMWTRVSKEILKVLFFKYAEYIPQAIIAPIINKSPLLKFKVSKILRSSLVIIARIPNIEINNPDIWKIFVFSIFNKKQTKIIVTGIAVLKSDALITWV